MRWQFGAVAGIIVFSCGVWTGNLNDKTETVYDTQIIRVPKTHVVHETKTVIAPLPKSCDAITDYSNAQEEYTHEATEAVGNIKIGMSELGKQIYEKSVVDVNRLTAYLQVQGDQLGNAAVNLAGSRNDIEGAIKVCKDDIAKVK